MHHYHNITEITILPKTTNKLYFQLDWTW